MDEATINMLVEQFEGIMKVMEAASPKLAESAHKMYTDFVNAGFTDEQAFEIVSGIFTQLGINK